MGNITNESRMKTKFSVISLVTRFTQRYLNLSNHTRNLGSCLITITGFVMLALLKVNQFLLYCDINWPGHFQTIFLSFSVLTTNYILNSETNVFPVCSNANWELCPGGFLKTVRNLSTKQLPWPSYPKKPNDSCPLFHNLSAAKSKLVSFPESLNTD